MKFPLGSAAEQGLTLRVGLALAALALTAGCSASILDAVRPALLPGRADVIHGPLLVPPDTVHKTPGRG